MTLGLPCEMSVLQGWDMGGPGCPGACRAGWGGLPPKALRPCSARCLGPRGSCVGATLL